MTSLNNQVKIHSEEEAASALKAHFTHLLNAYQEHELVRIVRTHWLLNDYEGIVDLSLVATGDAWTDTYKALLWNPIRIDDVVRKTDDGGRDVYTYKVSLGKALPYTDTLTVSHGLVFSYELHSNFARFACSVLASCRAYKRIAGGIQVTI